MRKKKLYVVGYDGDDEAIYGVKTCACDCGNKVESSAFLDAMSLTQARKELKLFGFDRHDIVIYKLVKVDPKKEAL